ncbi:zinc finger, CCHC-type containing protein [Tanacetum coccineum]
MASIHNMIIHQIDVKKTFLNGKLEEKVYMNQPQSFIMSGNKNKVCKLIKSLYGLKQASKQCHQKFDEVVLSNGYLLNQANKCVYSKFDEYGHEEADVILGIRIKHESNRMVISQSQYIEKVLKKFNYFDYTRAVLPMDKVRTKHNNGRLYLNTGFLDDWCSMYNGGDLCKDIDIAFVQNGIESLQTLHQEKKDRYKAATNILLQGLPKDIYTLINHCTNAKDIWDNVKMLLEGSELTKDERESQLYDEFEHFRQNKG